MEKTTDEIVTDQGEPVPWGHAHGDQLRVKTAPVGYPVQYVSGVADAESHFPVPLGSVHAATIVREREDGNLDLMVQFPHGQEGRTHVPHADVDMSGNVDVNGLPIIFRGGRWNAIVGEGEERDR